jgi:hypothetical protein
MHNDVECERFYDDRSNSNQDVMKKKTGLICSMIETQSETRFRFYCVRTVENTWLDFKNEKQSSSYELIRFAWGEGKLDE